VAAVGPVADGRVSTKQSFAPPNLERLQGINCWCGSVRGSEAGLEEERGELRYGLLRPTAGSGKGRAWSGPDVP